MDLGNFSISLAVSDISASKLFYEKLGFEAMPGCGSVEEKWVMMKKDNVQIGLFQDMFPENILTFNPDDARSIEKHLLDLDVKPDKHTEGDSGPTYFILTDPDGNKIMFDQF